MVVGRLTRDPEVVYNANGTVTTRFTLAENKYNPKTKEKTAQFDPCVAFGKVAETIGNILKKGQKITADGELRISEYTNKDGEKRTSVQIVVLKFDFADNKKVERERTTPTPIDKAKNKETKAKEKEKEAEA
jgi:single-strand DNA-binding protein